MAARSGPRRWHAPCSFDLIARNIRLPVHNWGTEDRTLPKQASMKYSSIRELFDYWNRPSGAQLVPECGEVENKSRVSPNHSADGGPGTSPNRLALALLLQRAAKRAFDIVVAIIGLVV